MRRPLSIEPGVDRDVAVVDAGAAVVVLEARGRLVGRAWAAMLGFAIGRTPARSGADFARTDQLDAAGNAAREAASPASGRPSASFTTARNATSQVDAPLSTPVPHRHLVATRAGALLRRRLTAARLAMALKIDPWSFPAPEQDLAGEPGPARIVLGGGCFWCTEAVYSQLDGVLAVRPGYAGGTARTADYKSVCTGRTDHAEVIEVTYDPARITLGQILKLFFSIAHDPTQKDRQGADVGRQYRSAIFYADEGQRRVAAAYIAQIEAAKLFDAPIRTTLEPLEAFYVAEDYHHDYAARNPGQPYIRMVAEPKVSKLREVHGNLLKAG